MTWPIPLPTWFWAWAQWRLGRGPYKGHACDPAMRPSSAPSSIPAWAWARLKLFKPTPAPQSVTMYDSINLSQIPTDAAAVAGYVNGRWPTFAQLATRFPKAARLSIDVFGNADADCLDVEKGDATPDQAPAWVKRQWARGVRQPIIYTSVSQAQALVNLLRSEGIPRTRYRLWTAHYTYKPHRCSSACGFGFNGQADATQYDDHALGRNLDASICAPGFFAASV